MVKERLNLEPEVQEIFQCIDKSQNFLLSGGAGSGKTYSLVQVIQQAITENPSSKVACMTYTNAAVKEIEERVGHKNLSVSTIHDFLWDNIKHFQKEIKAVLISLINDAEESKFSIEGEHNIPSNYFDKHEDGIQYKEYLKFKEGIISHDEILIVANHLFQKYVRLNDILKDKFKFIFIDEYQDTSKLVVDIFLIHFKQSKKSNIVGFFGDAMQSIYDEGIGDLDDFKTEVIEIKKEQNRRNPQNIIDLANIIRTDGIEQEPSKDPHAPNMKDGKVKEGGLMFIYSSEHGVADIKAYLESKENWNFTDTKETKELNLTHNLIADKAGFRTLMNIYDKDYILDYKSRLKTYLKKNGITTDFSGKTLKEVIAFLEDGKVGKELKAVLPTPRMKEFIDDNKDLYDYALRMEFNEFLKIYVDKDQLIDDKKQDSEAESKKGSKRDNLIKHLHKIQHNIHLYQDKQYNEFLRVTDYRPNILKIEDKRTLKNNIENLVNVGNKNIQEIIEEANTNGICIIGERLEKFQNTNQYIYDRVKQVKFAEFQKLYEYLEGFTPFSTQHKTKGAEFKDVFVVLDNGDWNKYNFEYLFQEAGTPSVLSRTKKLFYVCCTRSKERLVVFYYCPSSKVVETAKKWFGDDNVIDFDKNNKSK